MIVISDTTPLSELAKAGLLNLLPDIYGSIIIPQEVLEEVTYGVHPAVMLVQSANWIEVQFVREPEKVSELTRTTGLGLGECAAMILAEELGAGRILIDDLDARKVAQSRNLPVTGTVGTVLVAKQRGLIPSVKEALDALIAGGKRISQQLYQQALVSAGETNL